MTNITKPIHEIRLGAIKAAIWENETANGPRYNVTVSRLYKDGDTRKRSDSFGRDDLPLGEHGRIDWTSVFEPCTAKGRATTVLLLVGCDRHGSASDAAKPLAHFWFDYNNQPHPGKRVWVRLNQTTWAVLYPNGVQARYRTKGREEVGGLRGTVVEKFEGDPNETGRVFLVYGAEFFMDKQSTFILGSVHDTANEDASEFYLPLRKPLVDSGTLPNPFRSPRVPSPREDHFRERKRWLNDGNQRPGLGHGVPGH